MANICILHNFVQSMERLTLRGSENKQHFYIKFQYKRITRNLRLRRPQWILSGAHAKPNDVDTTSERKTLPYIEDIYGLCKLLSGLQVRLWPY